MTTKPPTDHYRPYRLRRQVGPTTNRSHQQQQSAHRKQLTNTHTQAHILYKYVYNYKQRNPLYVSYEYTIGNFIEAAKIAFGHVCAADFNGVAQVVQVAIAGLTNEPAVLLLPLFDIFLPKTLLQLPFKWKCCKMLKRRWCQERQHRKTRKKFVVKTRIRA